MHLALALLLAFPFGNSQKKKQAEAQLAEAKQALQDTISRTGDFDYVSPEFDDVLAKFERVERGTPARKEAEGFAQTIRDHRAAARQHDRLVERAAEAPVAPGVKSIRPAAPGKASARLPKGPVKYTPPPPADTCKAARARLGELRKQRRAQGKPALGETDFQSNGEVSFAPGAEPTPEEDEVVRTIKACNGIPAGGN